jgi:hypothetical protein
MTIERGRGGINYQDSREEKRRDRAIRCVLVQKPGSIILNWR